MPIKYALFENNLTTDPLDHSAQVQINASVDAEDIADLMVQQGSTTTKADILAVLEDAEAAAVLMLKQGNRVQIGGLVDLFPRIVGVFTSASDVFDPARHRIDVAANTGARVREEVRAEATVEKVAAISPKPTLVDHLDLATGSVSGTVTRGSIGTINGSRLQFAAGVATEGIFFVPTAGGAAIRIAPANVQKNKPGQLVYLVPTATLPPATYFLEVRARIAGGTELRIGRLDETVTVV